MCLHFIHETFHLSRDNLRPKFRLHDKPDFNSIHLRHFEPIVKLVI